MAPSTEPRATTEPPPAAAMTGMARFMQRNGPLRLTSITRCQSSSSHSTTDARVSTAALRTSRSTPPASFAVATIETTSASRVTLTAHGVARPPAVVMSLTTRSAQAVRAVPEPWGVDGAGRDDVGADLRPVLEGDLSCEGDEPGLGGAVRAVALGADEAEHRRRVHDAAAVAGQHVGDRLAARAEDGGEVRVDREVPVGFGALDQPSRHLDGGVVVQDVDSPERLD